VPEFLKAPLVLALFALLSVAITATAAGLALHRPAVSRLTLETRSRLVADYSADVLAKRLEPLNPDVIRAAADDEANLSPKTQTEITSGPDPATSTVRAGAAAEAPGAPEATWTPLAVARQGQASPTAASGGKTSTPVPTRSAGSATSTPGPSPSVTPLKPTPTFTPPPTFTPTPLPTKTPQPTSTPPPTNTPQPTATPQPTNPPPTSTPQPTATPKNVCDVLPLPPIPILCP
jgi:hypothetical protein